MASHRLAHPRDVDGQHPGEQVHGPVQVLRVLADDGDGEGFAILDKHPPVAVVQHAARRAQRQAALVIVLGEFLEAGVLHDLEVPETDGEASKDQGHGHLNGRQPGRDALLALSGNVHVLPPEPRKSASHRDARRRVWRRSRTSGRRSTIRNTTRPRSPFPIACTSTDAYDDGNVRSPSST